MRHEKEQTQKRSVPVISWILVAIAVLGLVSGGVVAYLSTSTGEVTNTFEADAPTNPAINDTAYSVNVGDPGYAVYVRAAVVVTWKDTEGNVLAAMPKKDTDYEIGMNTTDWFEHGGFWYHKSMVNTDGSTEALITSCTAHASQGDYTLSVEIIAQTIQALGSTDGDNPIPAVQQAWGVEVDANKQLKVPTTS